jgi:recombination protein RecA
MGKKRAKKQKLEMAVAHIQHRFGHRSLVKGQLPTVASPISAIPHVSTGFPKLDRALNIGGLPKGKVSELVGLPTSGKMTMVLKFLAQAQANGGQVAYIDQARFFDPDYAHRCGLDLSRVLVGSPYDFQEALAMAEALAQSGSLSALVFDTLDVFWADPEAVQHLTALLNRLIASMAHSGMVLLFLHAVSADGTLAIPSLAHHASVRLQIIREQWLRHHGDIRGYEARVEVLKNRFGPAGCSVTLQIRFNGTVQGNGL